MKFDPKKQQRHSIRLPGFDYSKAEAYYLTLVTHGRERLFGEVLAAEMKLNDSGQIVQSAWLDLPRHYPHLELDAFCVMPDHAQAIIVLHADPSTPRQTLPEIMRALKSFTARHINVLRKTPSVPVWQRDYYQHIISDEQDYQAKRDYMLGNPTDLKTSA
jgi:REP element-mobilizing transposase RayT